MTRYIDADALKLDIACVYGSNPKYLNWLNNAPTVDAVPVTFNRFRLVCKFFAVGYNVNRETEFACWRKDMIPEGDSWGICDKEHCPYMKGEE